MQICMIADKTKCARLVPFEQPTERRLGFVEGVITPAFFDPLDDEDLATWG